MPGPREQQYLSMISQFPESPLGYFSLGRYQLEQARFAEAAGNLRRCTELDPAYAAALLSLGDALAGANEKPQALEAYARARAAALAQNHPSLAEEIDERVAELD
jgi:tetratricopeptide (TPR) repeat protein